MDKIKWIRLIQWKFGGCGVYESIPVSSKIDENYVWSEPLRVDNKLSNINPWRDVDEENEAALRPRIQDISSC